MSANRIERIQLPLFFVLSFAISWAIWIPLAGARMRGAAGGVGGGSPVNMIAVWGPGLAAMILSLAAGGRTGLRALFRPLRIRRVGAAWYLFVLLYPAAVKLAAYGVDKALGRSYALVFMPIARYFDPQQAAVMVPAAFVAAVPNALGEELGWRGFAMPRLLQRFSALAAGLVLGLFWGIWHIPMWAMTSGAVGAHEIASLINIVGAAILFTWVYKGTRGSLLVAWLFHVSMTIAGYTLSAVPTLTGEVMSWLVIALVVVASRAWRPSRNGVRHAA